MAATRHAHTVSQQLKLLRFTREMNLGTAGIAVARQIGAMTYRTEENSE